MNKSILPHFVGFILVLLITLLFSAYYLFNIPKSGLFKLNTYKQIFTYHRPSAVNCQPNPSPLIYPQSLSNEQLTSDQLIFDCHNSCFITNLNLPLANQTFPAIGLPDPDLAVKTLDSIIVDPEAQIISYVTNLPEDHSRIVLDFTGKLLHYIDETPGTNPPLKLQYYDPATQMLVYQDNHGNHIHYSTTSIALFTNPCSK